MTAKEEEKPVVLVAEVNDLFDRVVAILDQARKRVVRSVNNEMVIAYWQIGREIVERLQAGEERAAYGRHVLQSLSERLTARYGKGFSVTNLRYFRLFYQAYADRSPEIHHKPRDESNLHDAPGRKHHEAGDVSEGLALAMGPSDPIHGFAARYVHVLPTAEELRRELERERHLLDMQRKSEEE